MNKNKEIQQEETVITINVNGLSSLSETKWKTEFNKITKIHFLHSQASLTVFALFSKSLWLQDYRRNVTVLSFLVYIKRERTPDIMPEVSAKLSWHLFFIFLLWSCDQPWGNHYHQETLVSQASITGIDSPAPNSGWNQYYQNYIGLEWWGKVKPQAKPRSR